MDWKLNLIVINVLCCSKMLYSDLNYCEKIIVLRNSAVKQLNLYVLTTFLFTIFQHY